MSHADEVAIYVKRAKSQRFARKTDVAVIASSYLGKLPTTTLAEYHQAAAEHKDNPARALIFQGKEPKILSLEQFDMDTHPLMELFDIGIHTQEYEGAVYYIVDTMRGAFAMTGDSLILWS